MSYANAPIVLNVRDRTGQSSYNNATFNAENQNIIQGDIKEISVSEVNFPYDIPNMQNGFNSFDMTSNSFPPVTVVVPPGFYTGTELVEAINAAALAAVQVEIPELDEAYIPQWTYSETNNTFTLTAPTEADQTVIINSSYTFPENYAGGANRLGKDIFSIMGFVPSDAKPFGYLLVSNYSATPADPIILTQVSGSAPLVFTQYIDICSTQLCGKQRFAGGSTTNLARRGDVICRLYISDNIAITTADPEGVRPFIINRQYYNARVMRWSTDNSISTIDIQLYDDVGQPLTTTWAPRPYQITFNCYERTVMDAAKEAKASSGINTYPVYQEKNTTVAWEQLSRQNPGAGKRR